MTYTVEFWNGHWTDVIAKDRTLEDATSMVKKLVAQFLESHHPELGRSVREETWTRRPYQVVINTMTAEAGNVQDVFSVVCQQESERESETANG